MYSEESGSTDVVDPNLGDIRQQIGEILGTARVLSEQMREQKEENRRQEDRINAELRATKEEHRLANQVITVRIEQLTAQVRELDDKARSITADLTGVKDDIREAHGAVSNLKTPVDSLMELKTKIIAYAMVLVSMATILWYVVGPVAHLLIETVLPVKK